MSLNEDPEVQDLREADRQYQAELKASQSRKCTTEAEFFQKKESERLLAGYARDVREQLAQRGVKPGDGSANQRADAPTTTEPSTRKPQIVSQDAIDAELRKLLHLKPNTPAAPTLKPGGPGASAPTSGESLRAQEQLILDRARKMQAAHEAKRGVAQSTFRRASRSP